MKAKVELARRVLARRRLLDFTCYTMADYNVGWHHRYLCDVLDQFAAREVKRLMVFMPPRHGKSELVSRRLPAYLLGRDRNVSIIATSYGADLAREMNRDCQSVMDTPEYLALFPGSSLPGAGVSRAPTGHRLRNADTFQLADRHTRGRYICAGVGGAITGKGADFAIIDDPIKNDEEAQSKTVRDKHLKWYTSTLRTRLEKDACILITQTRWHEDDLAGRLLEAAKNDPEADQWTVVNFPARKEDNSSLNDHRMIGDPLWPWKYDDKALASIKASVGPRVWAALYQQRPAPDEGGMFPIHCWSFANSPPCNAVIRVRYWDRAATKNGGDWTVGQLMSRDADGVFYVENVVRLQGDPLEVETAIVNTAHRDGRHVDIGIEEDPGQAGKFESAYYVRKLAGFTVRIVPARDSKETRARPYSSQVLAGNVRLVEGRWNDDLIDEHAAFPYGAHDDQVDSGSGAFRLCASENKIVIY